MAGVLSKVGGTMVIGNIHELGKRDGKTTTQLQ